MTSLLVLSASWTAGASAQNIISNPELTPDAAGWFGGAWDAEDVNSCSVSGSLKLSSISCAPIIGCTELGFWRTYAGDCLAVSPGETVHQDIHYTSEASVYLYLAFASDSACSVAAGVADNLATASPFPPGGWQLASRVSLIPEGVHSVVAFFLSGGAFQTDIDGKVDRAYLGFADRVFTDDFEGLSGCRWSFSVGEL